MIEEKQVGEIYFPKEVTEEADSLRKSLISSKEDRHKIALQTKDIDQLVLIGSGDCYFITHAAANAFEQLAKIPTRVYEAYDYYSMAPLCGKTTLVLGFSSSGKSMYTVQAIKLAKSFNAETIGLTNTPESQLVREASIPLFTNCGISYTFPTKTTTSALGVLFALANDFGYARGLFGDREHEKNELDILHLVSDAFQARIDNSQEDIIAAAKALFDCRHLLYIGSGVYRSTAMIGAAKIIETSRRHITACNAEEYLHLIGFSVRSQDGVVVCANNGDNDREHLVADYAQKQGAKLVIVGKDLDKNHWPTGALLISTYSNAGYSWTDALVSMIALHLLASEISKLGDKNPDIPDGVDVKYVINLLYTGPVAGWRVE